MLRCPNTVPPVSVCLCSVYNVRKEMKCSGDSEILHELVRDNTQKSEKLKLIREVS